MTSRDALGWWPVLGWIAAPSLLVGVVAAWWHWTSNVGPGGCDSEVIGPEPACMELFIQAPFALGDVLFGLGWGAGSFVALALVVVAVRRLG